jgi:hypothetical protein
MQAAFVQQGWQCDGDYNDKPHDDTETLDYFIH